MEHRDWQRLAKAVQTRRQELGVTVDQLAAQGGPSHQTLRNIERGVRSDYRRLTLTQLEQALGWKPGTAHAILGGTAGDDPEGWVRADFTGAGARVPAVSKEQARRAAIDALLDYAATLDGPEGSGEQRAVLALVKRLNSATTDDHR